jgi:hypothetical protein
MGSKRMDYLWAHAELLKGNAVMRFEARWFLQMVKGSIVRFRIDGADNRVCVGLATLTSGDLLAKDWTEYA